MNSLSSIYPWVKKKRAYWIWLNTIGKLLSIISGLKVSGRENIPDRGKVLLVSNHRSYLDPPLVAYAVRKREVFFMAKEELFKSPILGFLIKHWGNAFPVKRGRFDIKALKVALEILNSGELLCVFPEGTRAPKGKFLKPKWGAGMIALKAKAPIVPCLIEGSEDVMPKGSKFPKFAHVSIRFGEPFLIDLDDVRENYQRAADIMMEKIKELKEDEN